MPQSGTHIVIWHRQETIDDHEEEVFGPFLTEAAADTWVKKYQTSLGGRFLITTLSIPLGEAAHNANTKMYG